MSLTMYIVVNKNLIKTHGWSAGSVMAQACHAATAVLHETRDQPSTIQYLTDVNSMTKVVLKTKAAKLGEEDKKEKEKVKRAEEKSISELAELLKAEGVPLRVWIEQPDNVVSALATVPIPERSNKVKDIFKEHCSLYS